MRIKDFAIAIQTAHANALLFNRDYFVTIGTDMMARAQKTPTTYCWRVNADSQVWREEYLLQDGEEGLKLLSKTRDEETESRLIVNR